MTSVTGLIIRRKQEMMNSNTRAMRNTILLLTMVVCFGHGFGQSKSVVENTVYQLLESDLKKSDLLMSVLNEPNQTEVCRSILKYVSDSTKTNRKASISLVKHLEKKHKTLPEQTAQVNILFTALETLPLEESKPVFSQLQSYPKECFKKDQVDLIRDYLALPKVERKEPMLLLGFVGEHADIEYLKSMVLLYPLKKDDQFYMELALVRLGDAESQKEFLDKMGTMTIGDEFVINNLQNAVYTKNYEIYKRLLKEILNDEKNCMSANNDDSSKILCAYRLIEGLAPGIKDFPVKINRIGEIEGNPQEELVKARNWITANLQSFQINTSLY